VATMYEKLKQNKELIATKALELIDPDYQKKSYDYIFKSKRDILYSIDFMIEALIIKDANILINYFSWLTDILGSYDIKKEVVSKLYQLLLDLFRPYLEPDDLHFLTCIKPASFTKTNLEVTLSDGASTYLAHLLQKDRFKASSYIQSLVEANISIEDIFLDIVQPAMHQIGLLWQKREISVADEHLATVISQFAMTELYPIIFNTKKNGKRMVACALGNELHEMGIRMVSDLFEYYGYETYYLGSNTPVSDLVTYLEAYLPDLVCLSVTLSSQLSQLLELVSLIKSNERLTNVKLMIGGQAVSALKEPLKTFNVDGYASNAKEAIKVGDRLVELKRY